MHEKNADGLEIPGGGRPPEHTEALPRHIAAALPRGLPFATAEVAPVSARVRSSADDFHVEEIPAYGPTGEGEHLFVRFEKRELTTPEAVRRLAHALDAAPRGTGWAGLKDRHAVTIQWASFHFADPDRARGLQLDGIRVLEVARHRHKLRTGHLRGNRFELRLRDVSEGDREQLHRALELLAHRGVPNYYGAQRFGRNGDNLPRAWRWIVDGGPAPRSSFERKLLVSVWQAALFNVVVADRLTEGTLGTPLDGDLLRREDTGGLFVADDPNEAAARMDRWELSATGPMFGPRMRWPEGSALRREEAVLQRTGMSRSALGGLRRFAPGTRRPLRVPLKTWELVPEGDGAVRLAFELPKGAYATVVLRELLKTDDLEG